MVNFEEDKQKARIKLENNSYSVQESQVRLSIKS